MELTWIQTIRVKLLLVSYPTWLTNSSLQAFQSAVSQRSFRLLPMPEASLDSHCSHGANRSTSSITPRTFQSLPFPNIVDCASSAFGRSNSSAVILSRSIIASLTKSFLVVAVFATPFGFFLLNRL